MDVIHNTVRNPCRQTSAISIGTNHGGLSDVLVQDNLIAGGGYPLYCNGDVGEDTPNERIIGNRFSRVFYPNSGYHGTMHYCGSWVDVISGNKWDEDGSPVGRQDP